VERETRLEGPLTILRLVNRISEFKAVGSDFRGFKDFRPVF